MSDSNTSNPQDIPEGSGSKARLHELISSYIDNEIKDPGELREIESGIESDPDLYNRFTFEKLTKQRTKQSFKYDGPPLYLQKKIGDDINNYIRKASGIRILPQQSVTDSGDWLKTNLEESRSSLKRNLYIGLSVFVVLIAAIFVFQSMRFTNPVLAPNDLVAVSNDVYNKLVNKNISLQFETKDAKALSDSMSKYVNFRVFVPDVKDAELVGGICNEVNGEKLAHIIHKKGADYIYTLQGVRENIKCSGTKIVICTDYMKNVTDGMNWFTCLKKEKTESVIWHKDNLLCSSVAELESSEIAGILTNFK